MAEVVIQIFLLIVFLLLFVKLLSKYQSATNSNLHYKAYHFQKVISKHLSQRFICAGCLLGGQHWPVFIGPGQIVRS